MKRINISISKKDSIESAIHQLENYKQSLRTKADIFLERLALLGIPIIDARIAEAEGDEKLDKTHYSHIQIRSFGDYHQAVLEVQGKDIVFMEFGSGIHFNGNPHESPNPSLVQDVPGGTLYHAGGKELGYTIGSYGKGQGIKDHWFFYADDGTSVMSHGIQATMPLYSAELEMIKNIEKVAREVFHE